MSFVGLMLWGVGFGLVSAVPVGPVGVLIVRATLSSGPRAGVVAALGLLSAEALYLVLFALHGGELLAHGWIRTPLALAAVVLLVALAVRALRPAATSAAEPSPAPSARRCYRDAFVLTALHPGIAIIFAGLLTGAASTFGTASTEQHLVALLVSMEVGVALWLGVLVSLVWSFRHGRAMVAVRRHVDRVAGVVLLAFAVRLLLGLMG